MQSQEIPVNVIYLAGVKFLEVLCYLFFLASLVLFFKTYICATLGFNALTVILYVLSTIGLTLLMVDSTILEPMRNYLKSKLPASVYKVFECYQCMGFWAGIACALIFISFNPAVVFGCGCAGSYIAMIGSKFDTYLEAATLVNLGE